MALLYEPSTIRKPQGIERSIVYLQKPLGPVARQYGGYQEIGTQVDFTNYQVVGMDEFLVSGLAGSVGYQSYPGQTSVNLGNINLYNVKNALESSGKISINYMLLSWNNYGSQITDFRFGFVGQMKGSISMSELLDYLPYDLKMAINELGMLSRGDFKNYILGVTQSDYTYTWNYEALSDEYTVGPGSSPMSDTELRSEFINSGKVDDAIAAFKNKMSQEGFTAVIRGYTVTAHAEYIREGLPVPPYGLKGTIYRSRVTVQLYFDTNKPITNSPIAPAVVAAILIIISIFAGATALIVFNNLTTNVNNVTTRVTNPTDQPITVHTPQGDVTIPPGGTYEYSESSQTPPDWWVDISGYVTPIVILAAVGIGGFILVKVISSFGGKK